MSNSERKNMIDMHVKNTVDNITTFSEEWSETDQAFWTEMQPKIDAIYRKKNKRRVFILLFGIVFLASTSLYFLQENKNDKTQQFIEIKVAKESIENTDFSKNNSIASNDNFKPEIIENNLPNNNPSIKAPENLLSKTKLNSNYSKSTNTGNLDLQKISNDKNIETNSTRILTKNPSFISAELHSLSGTHEDKFQFQDSVQDKTSLYPINNTKFLKSPISLLNSEVKPLDVQFSTINEILIAKRNRNWEIGLGHTRFVRNPFLNIPTTTSNESLTIALIDKNYTSIDLIVNRNLGKRFSFTTGLRYIHQFVQLEYTVDDLVYTDDGTNVQNAFRSIIERNITPLTNSMQEDQLFIKLLPGKTLNEGDLINGLGIGNVHLAIYEVPFQVNLHQNIGRFEIVGFAGLSINWIQARIPSFDVELFVENDLISNDINFSPISEQIIIPNIILGGGLRYRIKKRYKLHSFYNHNPLDTNFSRIQFGLTYAI